MCAGVRKRQVIVECCIKGTESSHQVKNAHHSRVRAEKDIPTRSLINDLNRRGAGELLSPSAHQHSPVPFPDGTPHAPRPRHPTPIHSYQSKRRRRRMHSLRANLLSFCLRVTCSPCSPPRSSLVLLQRPSPCCLKNS